MKRKQIKRSRPEVNWIRIKNIRRLYGGPLAGMYDIDVGFIHPIIMSESQEILTPTGFKRAKSLKTNDQLAVTLMKIDVSSR
jgi:hypothetical protein